MCALGGLILTLRYMPYLGRTIFILNCLSDEEKTKDGQEKEIDFSEYLERINSRAID
jgi:hypothetical protein